MSEGTPAPSPVLKAIEALEHAEIAARNSTPSTAAMWAAIGHGWAVLAQTSEQHLAAEVAHYQALVTVGAAGALTPESERDMASLEDRIRKGLGL